jgi:hypothetical protein
MKRYVCITKVANDKAVKYHVSDIRLYKKFIDSNFPDWLYTNVYFSKSREKAFSFTQANWSMS